MKRVALPQREEVASASARPGGTTRRSRCRRGRRRWRRRCRTARTATKYRTNDAASFTTSATTISVVRGCSSWRVTATMIDGADGEQRRGQDQHHPLVVRPRPDGVGEHGEVHGDGRQARPGDGVRPVRAGRRRSPRSSRRWRVLGGGELVVGTAAGASSARSTSSSISCHSSSPSAAASARRDAGGSGGGAARRCLVATAAPAAVVVVVRGPPQAHRPGVVERHGDLLGAAEAGQLAGPLGGGGRRAADPADEHDDLRRGDELECLRGDDEWRACRSRARRPGRRARSPGEPSPG